MHSCAFVLLFFFFFKQKTAYELRISDWSSDVCSSDLDDRQDKKEFGDSSSRAGDSAKAQKPRDDRNDRKNQRPFKHDRFLSLAKHYCRQRVPLALWAVSCHRVRNEVRRFESGAVVRRPKMRSEEHTSELQSLMRISYAVF